jgi:hypothetical protein
MVSNAPLPLEFKETSSFPLTANDVGLTVKLEDTFEAVFPPALMGYSKDTAQLSGSEDFGALAMLIDRPYRFFVHGGTDPDL